MYGIRPTSYRSLFLSTALAAILGLTGCTSLASEPLWKDAVAGDGPGKQRQLAPAPLDVRNLPKSRSGNRSVYEVFGVQYAVLDSARNFREKGTASWYGTKFHGNATSSGEIYDMYQMTAAHKHLPLPTFARVTRLDTGQSIVVKVNDRGPFVGDRVIDLSYAAAASLGMLEHGKAEVLVEAISDHGVGSVEGAGDGSNAASVEVQAVTPLDSPLDAYIQLGAFGTPANAEALKRRVIDVTRLSVETEFESARQLYRVVIGPLHDKGSVDNALQTLASSGFSGYAIRKLAVH